MHRRVRARVAACLLAVPFLAPAVRAQPPAAGTQTPQGTISLDLDLAAAGNPVTLTRPADGIVSVGLVRSGKDPVSATVSTSPFSSDTGSISLNIVDCGNPRTVRPQPHGVTLAANSVTRLCLAIPALPVNSRYSGRLVVATADAPPYVRAITITPPAVQQGTLVLDRPAVIQTVRRSWWRPWRDDPQMETSVALREKTGAVALEGLSVRLEQVSAPDNGFDLARNAHFTLNGQPADDLTQLSQKTNPTVRTIPAGGQSALKLGLHNLEPGDYIATLRFAATNSAADDTLQRLLLTIHVRDSVVWALICLIVALLLSFFTTKVLTSERRRAALLQQIRSLKPAWFAAQPPIAPVVWVQAVLHKAQRLSQRFGLTSPDLIEQSIAGVRSVLSVLDNARQIRDKLKLMLDTLVFRRAVLALDRVLAAVGPGGLDDAAMQSIKARLSAFDDWLNAERFPAVFWSDIAPALQALQSEVASSNVPDAAKQHVADLKAAVDKALATPPTKRDDVIEAYEQYARLRILWEMRDDVAAFPDPKTDISKLFELADKLVWSNLTKSALRIRMPVASDPEGLEAYDTLEFSVESDKPEINTSYLFRHKVECHWRFTLNPTYTFAERRGLRRRPQPIELTPVSLGPSVVQYFPRAGEVKVGVTFVYETETKDLPDRDGPTIHPSTEYSIYRILAGTEVYSWLIAATVAIATGLSTYYFKGASWGTYQDYLTLFLWGVGVDQGKNFLQALQFYSASASAAPGKP
jgi:hypothetical protein